MIQDMKEMVEGCLLCQTGVGSTISPPMEIRETPEDVFQHCSTDFKGLIAGEYYLHVMIDNLSRYPIGQVVKSTKFSDLRQKLEDIFWMFGVPDL